MRSSTGNSGRHGFGVFDKTVSSLLEPNFRWTNFCRLCCDSSKRIACNGSFTDIDGHNRPPNPRRKEWSKRRTDRNLRSIVSISAGRLCHTNPLPKGGNVTIRDQHDRMRNASANTPTQRQFPRRPEYAQAGTVRDDFGRFGEQDVAAHNDWKSVKGHESPLLDRDNHIRYCRFGRNRPRQTVQSRARSLLRTMICRLNPRGVLIRRLIRQ